MAGITGPSFRYSEVSHEIISHSDRFETTRQEEYSLQEYLDLCKAIP